MKTYQFLVLLVLLVVEFNRAATVWEVDNSNGEFVDPNISGIAPEMVLDPDPNPEISGSRELNMNQENESPLTEPLPETLPYWKQRIPIDPAQYKHHVIFTSKTDTEPLCQGALITPDWAVGSAICFNKYKHYVDGQKIIAIMGVSLTNKSITFGRNVSSVSFHPSFDPVNGLNDLALIELDVPVDEPEETPNVGPITTTTDETPLNKLCTYSTYYNDNLFIVPVKYVDQNDCVKPFSVDKNQTLNFFCVHLQNTQIIATGYESLGSPLVCDQEVFGIKTTHSLFSTVFNESVWIESVVQTRRSHTHIATIAEP